MPISTKYGSTGRPPGEYHSRHSSKKLANNLEFLQPPFDIFSIGSTNNSNNSNNCNNNGGIICDEGILVDSKGGAGAGAGAGAINVALMNRIEDSNRIESNRIESNRIDTSTTTLHHLLLIQPMLPQLQQQQQQQQP
jgi:hypothetical protein